MKDDLTMELIHELGKLSIEELNTLLPIWMTELDKQGVGAKTKIYCSTMLELVIQKKKEKGRCIA